MDMKANVKTTTDNKKVECPDGRHKANVRKFVEEGEAECHDCGVKICWKNIDEFICCTRKQGHNGLCSNRNV